MEQGGYVDYSNMERKNTFIDTSSIPPKLNASHAETKILTDL